MSRVGSYDAQAIRDKLDEIVYKRFRRLVPCFECHSIYKMPMVDNRLLFLSSTEQHE